MATETRHPEGQAPGEDGEVRFDQEISRRKVLWAGVGILGVTLASMALMWWLSSTLVAQSRSRDLPLTEVQKVRRQQIREENRVRAQTETRIAPLLVYPEDAAYPGGLVFDHEPYPPDPDVPAVPVVQVAPWIDMETFLREQARIQESLGWDRPDPEDPSRGQVHLPLSLARDGWLAEKPPTQPPRHPEPGTTLGGVTAAIGAVSADPTDTDGAEVEPAGDAAHDTATSDVTDPGTREGSGAGE